ncbi:kinesin-related protein [Klebsormidium nitens]|uniref:Kinesin-related protein n=1 Tax=Klebsormidium nitens TaxID=105231 RepID=A0A1Y1IKF3_KLENI|nr:kinesin-related protein [Klebsormidium nitens]|eukprot:GAQ89631.1 kinesin-related protein [Klebsormidium nitens]
MEKISVSIRVRPLNKQEIAKGTPWIVDANSLHLCNERQQPIAGQAYTFDHVFNAGMPTQSIYQAVTEDIIQSTVSGFNGTVFAYGQTSSGKTHTMRGTPTEPGIIPLAIHHVFQMIEQTVDREFLLRVSYLEIYNEEINDLLNPENRKLPVHENLERGVFVAGLAEEIVMSAEHVLELMANGEAHRHIGETNMNQASSRSHTIFRMVIESREKLGDDDSSIEEHGCDAVRVSSLTLVDLAGSERVAKTGAEGARMKEGTHINKSLMTLGTVINKLAEGVEKNGGHIPYRDSKLTRILQPALGGNAKTAIICNVTPSLIHVEETRGTLQFAGRAKRIENCAQVNEIVTEAALLKRQQREIEELRRKLQGNNSEIMEGEIAKMRNAMLAIELEKERLALELEERRAEEQQRRAETEKRIREQQKKIDSLSHMVINSVVDDTQEKKSRKGNRRATWVPRIQPSVFTDLARDRPPLREVPQGLFGSGLPLPPRLGRSRDLPPAFDRLGEESPEPSTGRPFRISEENSLSDVGEESPGGVSLGRRSSGSRADSGRASIESAAAEPTAEQQLADLQQKYKELEERVQKEDQQNAASDQLDTAGLPELGSILEEDELPMGVMDRRGRSLGGADGHASVKALKAQLKQLEMEKVFMQRELDDLTAQTKMRASISKEELAAVYEELDEARRALADSPTSLVPSGASLDTLALQSRLSEALREKEAALQAAHEAEERAVQSARVQIQGLEERLAEALREKEAAEKGYKSAVNSARAHNEGLGACPAEVVLTTEEMPLLKTHITELQTLCEELQKELGLEKRAREEAEARASEVERTNAENEMVVAEFREKLDVMLEEKKGWEAVKTEEETCSGVPCATDFPDSEAELELAAKTEQLAQAEVALAEARQLVSELLNGKETGVGSVEATALEAELGEARVKIAELEGDLEEAVRVLEEDDVRRAEQQAALHRVEEELAQARAELAAKDDVTSEVEGLRAALATQKGVEEELTQTMSELAERANVAPEVEGPGTDGPEGISCKIESLEGDKNRLEKANESLAAELKDAELRAEKAEIESRTVAQRAEDITREKVALEDRMRVVQDEGSEVTTQREELARAQKEQEQIKSAAETAAAELEKQLGLLKEAGEERKGLLKTIAAMEGERQKMDQLMQSMGEEKDALLRSAELAVRDKEVRVAELETERARLEGVLRELEGERDALQRAVEESQRQAETVEREKEEAASGLRAQLQQVQEELGAVLNDKTALIERVALLTEARETLEANLRQQESSKESLEKQLAGSEEQLQSLVAEKAALEEAKSQLETTVASLEARVSALDSDCSNSRAALQTFAEQCARVTAALSELQHTLETSKQKLAAVETQKAELEAHLAETEAALATASQQRGEALQRVAELESQLETQRSVASEAFKELEATKQAQHKEVAALRADLAALRKEVAHCKAEPAALGKQRDALQKELEKLRAKMKDTEAKLKTALQDKNQLQAEKSAQERDLKRLRGQAGQIESNASKRESMAFKARDSLAVGLKSTKSELSSVQVALQNKSVELEKTAFELQMLQGSYKSLEGSVSELEGARECLTSRISEVEACLAGVSAERDQLAADAEAQSRELVLASQEAEKIAQELASLAAEHSALVDQLRAAEEGARRAEELAAELEKVKAEQAQVMEQMTESHFQFEEDRAAWEAKAAEAAKDKAEWEEQLASLIQLRTEMEARITGLDQERMQLKQQANEADSDKAALLEQVGALEQKTIEERKEYIEKKDQEVGRLVEEVAALKLQCEELEHQLALADKNLEDSNTTSSALETAARQREERLQEMLQQSMTQIAEARQELADRDDKVAQLQAASLRMDVLLDNANGKLQMAEDRATAAEEHVERVREQLARFKASAAQREKEIQDSAAEDRDEAERLWQEKVQAAEKAWQAQLAQRSAIVEQLQQQLAAAKDENESMRAVLNDLRARLEIEEERRKAAERDVEALAPSQGAAERVAQLEEEVGHLQAECLALKQEAQGSPSQGADSDQAVQMEGQLLEVTEQNRLLQKKLRKAEDMLERSKAWKEEVRRQREDEAKAKAELARLQASVERQEAERMQLAAELAAANAQNAKAPTRERGQFAAAAQASSEAAFQVKARVLLEERRDFKEKCHSLEGRLKELRTLVDRNGGKVTDFDKYAALKDLEYRVATGRAAADKLKAQVAQLEGQLKKTQSEKSQLQGKLQEVTFKNCALLRSESLHQLHAASPKKPSPGDGSAARPPLAERNKGLLVTSGDSNTPVKKSALSGHLSLTKATPPSLSRQSTRKEKENNALL